MLKVFRSQLVHMHKSQYNMHIIHMAIQVLSSPLKRITIFDVCSVASVI